jgi:hypothetical protein
MKKLLILLVAVFLNGAEESYQADNKMSWDRGVSYCFSIGGRISSIEQLERQFKEKRSGMNVDYEDRYYWTRSEIDINGAYSFDFSLGLPMADHKAKKYLVMCVK